MPLDFFLGWPRPAQVAGSCLLVFLPILFAGVIFARSFQQVPWPDRAFGYNIAGAMVGGLAESFSLLLGFRYLMLVALAFCIPGWEQRVTGADALVVFGVAFVAAAGVAAVVRVVRCAWRASWMSSRTTWDWRARRRTANSRAISRHPSR